MKQTIKKITIMEKVTGLNSYSAKIELETGEAVFQCIDAKSKSDARKKAADITGESFGILYEGFVCRGQVNVVPVLDIGGYFMSCEQPLYSSKKLAADYAYLEALKLLESSYKDALLE